MAPVLAITGMVARTIDTDGPLTPLERFLNLSSPGRIGSHLSLRRDGDGKPETVEEPEGEKGMGAAVAIRGPARIIRGKSDVSSQCTQENKKQKTGWRWTQSTANSSPQNSLLTGKTTGNFTSLGSKPRGDKCLSRSHLAGKLGVRGESEQGTNRECKSLIRPNRCVPRLKERLPSKHSARFHTFYLFVPLGFESFQQFGESAFRSKLAPTKQMSRVLAQFWHS
jgi:hypothetical protein